jgi:hypothetical protein
MFSLQKSGKQDASKLRIVALSIAPTLYIAEAEEWIASNASLLNLRLVAIANDPFWFHSLAWHANEFSTCCNHCHSRDPTATE